MKHLKHYIAFICSLLLLFGFNGVVKQALGQSLIAHWKFDEGTGAYAYSEVNSPATDGIFKSEPNRPTWETSDLAPIPDNFSALYLDDAFDAVSLDPLAVQPSSSFTIAVWLKLELLNNNCTAADQIFFIGDDYFSTIANGQIRFGIFESRHPTLAGKIFIQVVDVDTNIAAVLDTIPLSPGQWVHYASTFDATIGLLKLFRNGVEVGSKQLSVPFSGFAQPPLPANYVAEIGDDSSCAGSMVGLVDDLAIWDFPLTKGQINVVKDLGVDGFPILQCVGFEPPVADPEIPVSIRKPKRALPFKAELLDKDGYQMTANTISAPPVIQVIYTPGLGEEPTDISEETVAVGLGSDGNQFVFTENEKWQFNLKLGKNESFSASGTYRVSMAPGDTYVINPTCEAIFVIE